MKKHWRWMKVAIVALSIGSMASASMLYTEDFESGYTDGSLLTDYAGWFGDPEKCPVIEGTNGLAGSVGLSQANKTFQWKAHAFDFSNPAVTGVVMSVDIETTWIQEGVEYKPFDDDYLGWTVIDDSISSGDIFGIQLEGNEVRGVWRKPGGSSGSTLNGSEVDSVIVTIPGTLPELSWYRLRVEYTKLTSTSVSIDVSLTELDASGNPGAVVASGTIPDTDTYTTEVVHPAWFTGPMWLTAKNYNDKSAGNMDNISLEIIPEPATGLLLAPAAFLLLKRRRRRV